MKTVVPKKINKWLMHGGLVKAHARRHNTECPFIFPLLFIDEQTVKSKTENRNEHLSSVASRIIMLVCLENRSSNLFL